MSYSKSIKSKAQFIGKLVFAKDSINFVTPFASISGRINRKYFIGLGNVVYFFFLGDELMKIGKAAGDIGWYNRMCEYTKKRYNKKRKETWDATTRKIYNYMISNNKNELEVYVIKSPRTITTIKSPFTGKSFTVEVETAQVLEQTLIQEAMRNGEEIPFCREIMK